MEEGSILSIDAVSTIISGLESNRRFKKLSRRKIYVKHVWSGDNQPPEVQ